MSSNKVYQILWADDEIDLLKPHILFLKEKGYEVTPVLSGADAIEAVQTQNFDLIFKTFLFTGLGWEPRFILIKGETAELHAVGYCVQKSMKLALKEGKLSVHNLPIGSVVREGKLLKLEIAITNALLKQMPSEHLTQGEGAFVLKAIADQGLDLKITATGTK